MFPLTIKLQLLPLLIVATLSFVCGQDRTITPILNPGCESCDSNTTLIYIRADGSNNTIHQLWDFTRGLPTMIFAIGSLDSTLEIKWHGNDPAKFIMTKPPKYSFAVAIDKIIEYDDLDDSGHLQPDSPRREHSLRRALWSRNESVLTDTEVMLRMQAPFRNGLLEIKLDLLPFKDYAVELPHLIHTANSTLMDISMLKLETLKIYNASRFALHLVMVGTDNPQETMRYIIRKSLDDEHSPGVFEVMEIKTPESYWHGDGGFLQFRPVGYTEPVRNVASSTNAHVSDFTNVRLPEKSTLSLFYPDTVEPLVQDMYVSFGDSGDGFYKQQNYTAWSLSVGYGSPPAERVSLLVVVVVCVGVGVPLLLAGAALLHAAVSRCRRAREHRRERLHEED